VGKTHRPSEDRILALQGEETMNIGPDLIRQAAGQRCPTRRQLFRTAAGTAIFGGALGSGLFKPGLAASKGSFAPVPIPGGTPGLNGMYHTFGPGLFDPIDAEPITITNFDGFIGLSYTNGTVTQTNTSTGESLRLPFLNSDLRFMQGNFRGTDGRVHQGTFAFV
jgi:hypothetical protein